MSEQTAIMIELEGQNYAGPPQPSMESFLPYVPDIVCISFQWSHHTCLRPAMVILLNLIIPERNVEIGYDYWSNYSDKSTNLFWPSLIPRSFFRRFLFQQNLQGEKAILGQLVKKYRKKRRTCCPPMPFSHFWYLTEVKPRFSATSRSSSFNDALSARAVIWAYLLYLNR